MATPAGRGASVAAFCVSVEPVGAPSVFAGWVVAAPGCVAGGASFADAVAEAPAAFFGPSMWARTRSMFFFSSRDSRLDNAAKYAAIAVTSVSLVKWKLGM